MQSLFLFSVLVSVLVIAAVVLARAFVRSTPRRRLTSVLVGALALVAVAPGTASAANIGTGLADNLFQDPRSSVRDLWFDRAADANVNLIRINVNWSSTVPNARPADATDPADPAYGWGAIDRGVLDAEARGLDVQFLLNTAPRWAEGPGRPPGEQKGSWKPDAGAFGKFGEALATRYSGSYPNPEGGGALPKVRYFEVFNEPNLDFWISPQFEGGKNTGPEIYRALHNSFSDAVKSVDPSNQIIGPALAPFGGITEDRKTRTRPQAFMRRLFCLKDRKKLKPKKCPKGGKVTIDIISHHPITVTGPPNQKAGHPDDATAGDMDEIKRIVRAAERGKTILPRNTKRPIWVTEYWFRSNPPASGGVPLLKHARWIQQSLYIFWKEGIDMAVYNLIRDRPAFDPESAFGLYFRDGSVKPAATAFAFPFVADRRTRKVLKVWGKSPQTGKVVVERRKSGDWKTVARINAEAGDVFRKKLKLRGGQELRASIGGEQSLVWKAKN